MARREQILLINYDFPPGLSGVRRIVKFAKYLPESGIDPIVLTALPDRRMPLDLEALAEVQAQGYSVTRTPSMDPYHIAACVSGKRTSVGRNPGVAAVSKTSALRRGLGSTVNLLRRGISVPDDRIGWLPFAIPAAERILRRSATRFVLTSSFPNSTHLAGLYLKRRYKIKWVADFRDGWTQNPYFADYPTRLHRRVNESLERQVVENADAVLTVSEPIAQHLRELGGFEKVFVIPNGFDEDDFGGIEPIAFDRFTLAYTGSLFMQRSPDAFFAALRGLLDCYPGLHGNFQVIFRSKLKPQHEAEIRELGLQNVVFNWGLGSYREALQLQVSADALLVLEGEAPNSEIMLTQKIFEYLAAKKPIVAMAPPGALADLVRRSAAGIVIPPDNVFRMKEILFELFLGRMTFTRDDAFISGFSRRNQARQLAGVLKNLIR